MRRPRARLRRLALPIILGMLALGTAAAGPDDHSSVPLVFERHYDLPVGDKGEDRFDVPHVPPACGRPGLAFESADITYVRKRFAQAQVVSTPEAGCVRCGPIVVRRYHEPTGELHYQLRVRRREVDAPCP